MNKYISIVLISILISCNSSSEKKETANKNASKVSIIPKDRVFGTYISKEYLAELETSGSTKKAQEKGIMSTGSFRSDENIYRFTNTWNFHEGGGDDEIIMITKTKGACISDNGDTLYQLDFSIEDELYVFGYDEIYELKKFSNTPRNQNIEEIINETIITGKYSSDKGMITFHKDGNVSGLDSINKFNFNIDYYDAGMDFDMIHLYFQGKDTTRTFGYEFKHDSLIIFKLNCEYAEEYDPDFCLEHSKGEPILNLRKMKN